MTDAEAALEVDDVAQRMRFDAETSQLVGGRCPACGRVVWPRRGLCPTCSTVMEPHHLPREGTLVTWSRAHVPLNGIATPYVLGLVEVGGARIFCHVRTEVDMPVPFPVAVEIDAGTTPPFHVRPGQPEE